MQEAGADAATGSVEQQLGLWLGRQRLALLCSCRHAAVNHGWQLAAQVHQPLF